MTRLFRTITCLCIAVPPAVHAQDSQAVRLLRAAARVTGMTAAAGRELHVSGFDVVSHAFESDRMYDPPLMAVNTIDSWYDVATAADRTSSMINIAGNAYDAGTVLSNEARGFTVRDSALSGGDAVHAAAWATRPLNVWATLADWLASPDVHVAGRVVYRDYPRTVLARRGLRGEERLLIDEKSGYPVKLDRVEPDFLWGQTHVEFLYDTWQQVGAAHLPGAAYRMVDGVPSVTRVFGAVHLAPRDSVPVRVPPGAAMGFAPPAFLTPSNPDTTRVSATTYVLRNAGYGDVVTLVRDTVFVLDASQGDARARHDADWIARLFPGHHPVVVVVTDLAWPHVAGVRYWVAQGATIVSHRASRSFLQRVVDRRWTLAPDELEKHRATARLRFRAVDDSLSLGGGGLLLFPIDGIGSEVALAAFVRRDGFLWASDFIQNLSGPTQYTHEVWSAAQRVGVAPKLFAAEHVRLDFWSRVDSLAGAYADTLGAGSLLLETPHLGARIDTIVSYARGTDSLPEREFARKVVRQVPVALPAGDAGVEIVTTGHYAGGDWIDTMVVRRTDMAPVWEDLSYPQRRTSKHIDYSGATLRETNRVADSTRSFAKTFGGPVFAFSEVDPLIQALPFAPGYRTRLPLYSEGDDSLETDSVAVVARAGRDWVVRFADPAIVVTYRIDAVTRAITSYDLASRRSTTRLRQVTVRSGAAPRGARSQPTSGPGSR